jgi:hypothetical protein
MVSISVRVSIRTSIRVKVTCALGAYGYSTVG